MKRLVSLLLLVILVLALIALTRAALLKPQSIPTASMTPIALDNDGAIKRFIGAIQIPTESKSEQPPDLAVMQQMHSYLQQSFPKVHATLQREVLPDGALLYTWKGKDPSAKPVILMGHFDVVPAAAETLSQWKHSPYSGDVADGFIWGRGTIDDKIHVLSLLEAAETMIGKGFTPSRTILFAFGDDEENGGSHGAVNIVKLLQQRGVQPEFVVDEGGMVVTGATPGLTMPLALIGTSEKGILGLTLSTTGTGGHSSEPPPHTAIGQLSAAITKLEAHPMPASLPSVLTDQYAAVAPYLPFSKRLLLANLWLFKPLIISQGLKNQTQAGNFHTTTAVDMISGGFKDNALPTSARAVVNFRILPGDTAATVTDHVRKVINDPGVSVSAGSFAQRDPSPISPLDSAGYRTLSTTIHQLFPEAVIVPNLLNAATDSSYYTVLTPNVYRFLALEIDTSVLGQIHGINERVAPDKYLKTVQFNAQLLKNIQ
ncbi:M20/M25/M40 family metallo-hydrolase [Granulicella sp. WH15]|uniref:M20 family peptidase n=1 Tax=Granulicella sp. WH15 TaxID=2602070 RepID=UPI001367216D|nr:M20 family peptidase [Granulicella sp. WH15]QHN02234.1 M20/M25/M40 family metallo-hydrolase [Granulicella sp. WH15]